jgi:hypothetical protein
LSLLGTGHQFPWRETGAASSKKRDEQIHRETATGTPSGQGGESSLPTKKGLITGVLVSGGKGGAVVEDQDLETEKVGAVAAVIGHQGRFPLIILQWWLA